MTSQSDRGGDFAWLLEPPGAGEVQFHIAIGEGFEVTDEVREAIERLLGSLQQEEVEGYRKCYPRCPELADCPAFSCRPLNNCSDLCSSLAGVPCAVNVSCAITRSLLG